MTAATRECNCDADRACVNCGGTRPMSAREAAKEDMDWALNHVLPERHSLDYYKVLGALVGRLMAEGYGRRGAEAKAVEILKSCKRGVR